MIRPMIAALSVTAFLLVPVVARGQGLADAARKERVRRKETSAAGAAKVYTESDLPTSSAKESSSDASAANSSARVSRSSGQISASQSGDDGSRRQAAAEWTARIAEKKLEIAELEVRVQRFANHPTGGGKVCPITKPIDFKGNVAPQQLVCPYQMESRYDVAKREMEKAKTELAELEQQARSLGIVPNAESRR